VVVVSFIQKSEKKLFYLNVWDVAIASIAQLLFWGITQSYLKKQREMGLSEILGQGSIRQIDAGLMLAAR
jgi:hypothetical protein